MRLVFGFFAAILTIIVMNLLSGMVYELYFADAVADYVLKFVVDGGPWLLAAIYEPSFYFGILAFSIANISIPSFVAGMVSGKPIIFSTMIGLLWALIMFFVSAQTHRSTSEIMVVIGIMMFQFSMALGAGFLAAAISNKRLQLTRRASAPGN